MRTRLVVCAALAALIMGCENTQITEVNTHSSTPDGTNPTNPTNPSTSGIDYTPRGGSGRVSTSVNLQAICGTAVCPAQQPFWSSNHPELIAVRGSTQGPNGFYVGMTATLTFIAASGNTPVDICVQPSITATTPKQCYRWTSTP